MSTPQDEARRLRLRDDELSGVLARLGRATTPGMPCLPAQTKKLVAYPTIAQSFYACAPITVLGPEVEGGPGAVTTGPSTFFALNLGTAVPPTGTNVLATFVDSRWVFRYDG